MRLRDRVPDAARGARWPRSSRAPSSSASPAPAPRPRGTPCGPPASRPAAASSSSSRATSTASTTRWATASGRSSRRPDQRTAPTPCRRAPACPAADGGPDRRAAVERRGGAPARLRRARRRDRGGRDGARQHRLGLDHAAAGLPRGRARADPTPRRAAHLRRGAVGLPHERRRRPGRVRRDAGPDHARQGARWRHRAECLRRQPRRHVAVSPLGRAVHSGTYNAHLVPVLAGARVPGPDRRPGVLPRPGARSRPSSTRSSRPSSTAPASRSASSRTARGSASCSVRSSAASRTTTASCRGHDTALANRFYGLAMEAGVYFHAGWHHGFSAAHTPGRPRRGARAASSRRRADLPPDRTAGARRPVVLVGGFKHELNSFATGTFSLDGHRPRRLLRRGSGDLRCATRRAAGAGRDPRCRRRGRPRADPDRPLLGRERRRADRALGLRAGAVADPRRGARAPRPDRGRDAAAPWRDGHDRGGGPRGRHPRASPRDRRARTCRSPPPSTRTSTAPPGWRASPMRWSASRHTPTSTTTTPRAWRCRSWCARSAVRSARSRPTASCAC